MGIFSSSHLYNIALSTEGETGRNLKSKGLAEEKEGKRKERKKKRRRWAASIASHSFYYHPPSIRYLDLRLRLGGEGAATGGGGEEKE